MAVIYQPCNQFGGQEPLSGKPLKNSIDQFFEKNDFPLTDNQYWLVKDEVVGENITPLFDWLISELPKTSLFSWSDNISWNWEKFVIVDGKPTKRYGTLDNPMNWEEQVQEWIDSI